MNIAMLLENMTVEKFGDAFEPKMVTDLVPVGKTLIYGESGSGKTYGIIKHLNRHQIKPVLLDFDHNKRVDNLDFYFVDGAFYLEKTAKVITDIKKEAVNLAYKSIKDRVIDILENAKSRLPNGDKRKIEPYGFFEKDNYKELKDMWNQDYLVNAAKDMGLEYELEGIYTDIHIFNGLIDEIIEELSKSKPTSYHLQNETVIIDTCANALKHFDTFAEFESFVNRLLRDENNVVLVAHSSSKGNRQTPDIDEVFANHVDCKLELNRDITKTKGEEIYLIVKKLRGYKGNHTIKNWER